MGIPHPMQFHHTDLAHGAEWRYTYMSGRVSHYVIDAILPGSDKIAALYKLRNLKTGDFAWATHGTLKGVTSTKGWQLERHFAETAKPIAA